MTPETFEMLLQIFVLLARIIAAGQWACRLVPIWVHHARYWYRYRHESNPHAFV